MPVASHSSIMDEEKALAELRSLSRDAKLWLMDRIGNNMNSINLNNQLGRPRAVAQSIGIMISDMQRIDLFELNRGFHTPQEANSVTHTDSSRKS